MKTTALVIGGVPYARTSNQTSLHTVDALVRAGTHVTYVCRRKHQRSLRKLLGINPLKPSAMSWTADRVHDLLTILWAPSILESVPMAHPEMLRQVASRSLAASLRSQEKRNGRPFDAVLVYWWFVPEAVSTLQSPERVLDVIDRHWDPAVNGGSEVRAARQKKLLLRTAAVCKRVVTVSEAIALELAPDIADVQVLPNGFDVSRLKVRERQNSRRKVVAYVGGMNNRFDSTLFNNLARINSDWLFLVAGGGPASLDIEPADNVHLLGNLDYADVQELLGRARYGIVPFKASQYLSASNLLKVLDYLGAGLRVLATHSVELGLVAEEGEPAVNVASGQEMIELLRRDQAELLPCLNTDMAPYSTDRRIEELLKASR